MRHDDKLRKSIKEHLKHKFFQAYVDTPFLLLGKLHVNEIDDKEELKSRVYDILMDDDELEAILPFSEFVVFTQTYTSSDLAAQWMIENDEDTHTYNKGLLKLFNKNLDIYEVDLTDASIIFTYEKEDRRWFVTEISAYKTAVIMSSLEFTVDGPQNKIVITDAQSNVIRYGEKLATYNFIRDDKAQEIGASDLFVSTLIAKLGNMLIKLQKARDKHLVEVKRVLTPAQKAANAKSKRKGKPLPHREDLPHYVYLDAPRVKVERSGEPVKGSHKTHRGHNRRGHWRRLDNPRFQKHPKYGGKVWVRPTWVGPTEWTMGNTIYTLKDINVGSEKDGHQYH